MNPPNDPNNTTSTTPPLMKPPGTNPVYQSPQAPVAQPQTPIQPIVQAPVPPQNPTPPQPVQAPVEPTPQVAVTVVPPVAPAPVQTAAPAPQVETPKEPEITLPPINPISQMMQPKPQTSLSGLSEVDKLRSKLQQSQLPSNLMEKAHEQIERINMSLKYGGNLAQLDMTSKYIDWITSLPWNTKTPDIFDIARVKKSLDEHHYGLERIKSRIMEYMSVMILQKERLKTETMHAQPLFFVGLAGTGKTTFAISLAESLGRKFVRIPFGGLSSALDLRGQSKVSPESEPGMIMKALRRVGSRNPVILLDELDRVAPETRSSVMGVLLELLDPSQNKTFTDYFIDYPFDLSEVIFVATANNTANVATAVLDRLELIQMPSYTDEEKIHIAKNYVLPKYLKQVGLTADMVTVDDKVWDILVRGLGFEPGIRSLERLIEQIVRKIALKMVSSGTNKFNITEMNMREYAPL